jgi:hypothetical protein
LTPEFSETWNYFFSLSIHQITDHPRCAALRFTPLSSQQHMSALFPLILFFHYVSSHAACFDKKPLILYIHSEIIPAGRGSALGLQGLETDSRL